MLRGYIGFGLGVVIGVLFLTVSDAHATGESYSWKDYSTIGAKGGGYKTVNLAEGDASAVEFKQDANDPAKFTAKPASDCDGGLTLTFTQTDTATLSSGGNCAIFASLDKSVSVTNGTLVSRLVETDSQKMLNDYKAKECKSQDENEQKTCTAQAEARYKTEQDTCRASNDISQKIYLANKYLDCLAQALGVERPGAANPDAEDESSTQQECAIEDVGWMLCQMMSFTAWIADQAFDFLTLFLEVDPLHEQVNGKDSQVFATWKYLLAFANVIILIALLFMVFSYVTGWGISMYGVQSLTPRLIVTVLMVNLSFYACGIAIDLSNVLGKTLRETLVEITPPASGTDYTTWSSLTNRIQSITPVDEEYNKENGRGGEEEAAGQNEQPQAQEQEQSDDESGENPTATNALLMGATIAGGAVLFANLSALVPFMVSALIAMIIVLVILLARHAAIICLVVISPIAVACYALPNTRQWTKKWGDMFIKLLMLYPVVSLLFGASYFASYVIADRSSENDQTFLAIFALGIQVIPLFLLPVIIKSGAAALGQIGNAISNQQSKGPLGALSKRAGEFRDDRKQQQRGRAATGAYEADPNKSKWRNRAGALGNALKNPNAARLRRKMKREAGRDALGGVLDRAKAEYYGEGDKATAIAEAAANGLTGEARDKALEEAVAQASKGAHDITVSRVGATVARYQNQGVTTADAHEMAMSGIDKNGNQLSDIERAAALQMAANTAESTKAHELILGSAKLNGALRRVLVDSLRKNGFNKSNAHFGGSALNKVAEGKIKTQDDIDQLVVNAAAGNKFSPTSLSGQSDHTLDMANRLVAEGKIAGDAKRQLVENAETAFTTPKLRNSMGDSTAERVNRLRGHR